MKSDCNYNLADHNLRRKVLPLVIFGQVGPCICALLSSLLLQDSFQEIPLVRSTFLLQTIQQRSYYYQSSEPYHCLSSGH